MVSVACDALVLESEQQLGLESKVHWERCRVGSGLPVGRECLAYVCILGL